MARKVKEVRIQREGEPGRDDGKTFVLTEMPAMQAEKWAMRALLGLTRSDIDIPEGIETMGWLGLAYVGLRGLKGLRWEEAEPLFDEMLSCVTIRPSPDDPRLIRNLLPDDIEEIDTLLELRKEIFELHAGFLMAVFRSLMAQRADKTTS